MAAPSYSDSKETLIEVMRQTAGSGNRQFDIAKAILDAKASEELGRYTQLLSIATMVLAIATIVLALAALHLLD